MTDRDAATALTTSAVDDGGGVPPPPPPMTPISPSPPQQHPTAKHRCVVLFYKYFTSDAVDDATIKLLRSRPDDCTSVLRRHQLDWCRSRSMKGRILLSAEGINGTLSATDESVLNDYVKEMERFDLVSALRTEEDNGEKRKSSAAVPTDAAGMAPSISSSLYSGVDWKTSTVDDESRCHQREPFPDLKVSIVKEIVSTGGSVDVDDIPSLGGRHLSPEEFHEALMMGATGGSAGINDKTEDEEMRCDGDGNGDESSMGEARSAAKKPRPDPDRRKQTATTATTTNDTKKKPIVLIDVRNTFEHAIGHFVNPTDDNAPALNPNMVTFSHFDSNFASRHANEWKDKTVLMYCTGGIRCEKASIVLKKRGVDDVLQLKGGIHRYLETYGDQGLFKGKNFVFDQRVALDPPPMRTTASEAAPGDVDDGRIKGEASAVGDVRDGENNHPPRTEIVGRCLECSAPFDEISGSRLCTVCRDLVLVCPSCQTKLNEYHCDRHRDWRHCYFTFLEAFGEKELAGQVKALEKMRDGLAPAKEHKNARKTLSKQIAKVRGRIKALAEGVVRVDRDAPRRCRTCWETEEVCDGLCWGFWKHTNNLSSEGPLEAILPISVGDRVEPGDHWNELRLGSRHEAEANGKRHEGDGTKKEKRGTVVDVKSWGSGGDVMDCVSVVWDIHRCDPEETLEKKLHGQPQIYRWGVLARNGQRMYDVRLCCTKESPPRA